MILDSSELLTTVVDEIRNVTDSIIIISAFSKLNTLEFIDNNINEQVKEKKILLRWRLEDLQEGVTDIGIYRYCKENNWTLYINFDLHAKVYLFNRIKCIIGSSNLTNKGFGLNKSSNIEINTLVSIDKHEERKVLSLFDISYELNDVMFNKMKDAYESNGDKKKGEKWSEEILREINESKYKFWSYELITSNTPLNINCHDIEIIGIKNKDDLLEIKQAFMQSKIYKWLNENVNEEQYFGALSQKLHEAILDDPSIYRITVKEYLKNIFTWIEVLDIDEFKIDKPRYSQRIRRI
ncbi:phospholipase D-like domain-containing protein [Clostridium butyricum]|uniref:phospholipase D-like domain-containing protein n=1 Tax=Clostridium butyricum TaxID=1492 RepID=UPI0018AAEA41|nr:phospholipase D-like domain-containing protein [Clostridium butyricum]